jgi:ParB family transcriptional regulator, chromosome partitioning protein
MNRFRDARPLQPVSGNTPAAALILPRKEHAMDPILHLPLEAIDATALPRDRATLDPAAMDDLTASIAQNGLRQPVEVWQLTAPAPPLTHGLIAGFRRLEAHRRLSATRRDGAFATIPAFLRSPASLPAALAAMVEENECRAEVSPWDKARLLVEVTEQGLFPTIDAATAALHATTSRQKRARLRAAAAVVEELDGLITTPEAMAERHMLRLSAALRGGFTELFHQILQETRGQSFQSQWAALLPTLLEAEKGEEEIPATPYSPARPRRMLSLPQGLILRREMTTTGYTLRFSGPEAKKGGLMEDVMDMVERMFMPGTQS